MNGLIMASNRLLSLLVYLALIIISVHTIDSVIRTSFYFSMVNYCNVVSLLCLRKL